MLFDAAAGAARLFGSALRRARGEGNAGEEDVVRSERKSAFVMNLSAVWVCTSSHHVVGSVFLRAVVLRAAERQALAGVVMA